MKSIPFFAISNNTITFRKIAPKKYRRILVTIIEFIFFNLSNLLLFSNLCICFIVISSYNLKNFKAEGVSKHLWFILLITMISNKNRLLIYHSLRTFINVYVFESYLSIVNISIYWHYPSNDQSCLQKIYYSKQILHNIQNITS